MRRNDQVCPSWHIEGEEICWIMLAGTMKRLESISAVGSESATVSRPQVRFGRRTNRPEDPSKKICRDVWEKQNALGKCFGLPYFGMWVTSWPPRPLPNMGNGCLSLWLWVMWARETQLERMVVVLGVLLLLYIHNLDIYMTD